MSATSFPTAFMHHGVEEGDRVSDLAAFNSPSVRLLRAQLTHLRRHYHFVSIDAVAESCRNGAILPPRAALLTFDDGFRSVLTRAAPVMAALGIPGVVFVVASTLDGHIPWFVMFTRLMRRLQGTGVTWNGAEYHLGDLKEQNRLSEVFKSRRIYSAADVDHAGAVRELGLELGLSSGAVEECLAASRDESLDFLTEADLRACEAAGIAIGSHSSTHASMQALTGSALAAEIIGSRERLSRCGVRVRAFSYPDGRSGLEARLLVAQAYDVGFGVHVASPERANLPRFDLWRHTPRQLWRALQRPPLALQWLESRARSVAKKFGAQFPSWG